MSPYSIHNQVRARKKDKGEQLTLLVTSLFKPSGLSDWGRISDFLRMTWLRVFPLPPEWDVSALRGFTQPSIRQSLFIHLGGVRYCER